MTDGDALLAAIKANPRDDTPRLVYADWLEENGDRARAAFVRDCPLLRHRRVRYGRWEWSFDRYGTGDPCFCGIPQQFLPEAVKVMPARVKEQLTAYTIRRGFLDTVTLHPTAWTCGKSGRLIRAAHPVTAVVFDHPVPWVEFPSRGEPGVPFKARLIGRLEFREVPRGRRGGRKCPGLALCRIEWPGIDFSYAPGV